MRRWKNRTDKQKAATMAAAVGLMEAVTGRELDDEEWGEILRLSARALGLKKVKGRDWRAACKPMAKALNGGKVH